MLPIRGIQKNPHRLLGLGAKYNRTGINLMWLPGIAIDVKNAMSAVTIGIHQNPVNHGVRNQGAISRLNRIGHSCECRIKVRTCLTATFAGTAVMTRSSTIEWTSDIGGAGGSDGPAQLFLGAIAKQKFLTCKWHRRLELAIRQSLETFCLCTDYEVVFYHVVIRFNVFVDVRPV